MGGMCGDLVAGIIDPTDVVIGPHGQVTLPFVRQQLKKPHTFVTDYDKDNVLNSVPANSLSSHDYDYHLKKQHKLLGVGTLDLPAAVWAAERFKLLHRPTVWAEMTAKCGAATIDEYAMMYVHFTRMMANNPNATIIEIQNIINGQLIDELLKLNFSINPQGYKLYQQWLTINLKKD